MFEQNNTGTQFVSFSGKQSLHLFLITF